MSSISVSLLRLLRFTENTPADARLVAWRAFLRAARTNRCYRPVRGFLLRASSQQSAAQIAAMLTQVPPMPSGRFFTAVSAFRNPDASDLSPQSAKSLWDHPGRLAVIQPWFRVDSPARIFIGWRPTAWTAFRPEVLAAPVAVLRRMLGESIPGPSLAVIAVTGIGQQLLNSADREALWRRYRVPVYEQFRGFQGELLASDCEAHDGLHVNPESAHWENLAGPASELLLTSLHDLRYPVLRLQTGLQGTLDAAECGCGRPSQRIVGLAEAAPPRKSPRRAPARVLTAASGR